MLPIKRETIIKPGDVIVDTAHNKKWSVLKIEGMNFFLKTQDGQEKVVTKFDMIGKPEVQLWPADGRGYH